MTQTITIVDIWDSLIASEEGEITISLPSADPIPEIKRSLSKYKHAQLKANSFYTDLLGEFILKYDWDRKQKTLRISRVTREAIMPSWEGAING